MKQISNIDLDRLNFQKKFLILKKIKIHLFETKLKMFFFQRIEFALELNYENLRLQKEVEETGFKINKMQVLIIQSDRAKTVRKFNLFSLKVNVLQCSTTS